VTATFGSTIRALRMGTEEEADVAAYLEYTETQHQPTNGHCPTCDQPWPCSPWRTADQTGLIYLGRAQDRVWAHTQEVLNRTNRQEKTA
jgi:hypothetical protein